MSAHPHALFERTPVHRGVTLSASAHAARLAEVRSEVRGRALTDAWKSLPVSWRTVLVMLACGQAGRPELIAQQPWEAFSAEDQVSMATCARRGCESLQFFGAVA